VVGWGEGGEDAVAFGGVAGLVILWEFPVWKLGGSCVRDLWVLGCRIGEAIYVGHGGRLTRRGRGLNGREVKAWRIDGGSLCV